MAWCERCRAEVDARRLFCQCGKRVGDLRTVRLAGFVGVRHTTNPVVEEFWRTGEPDVFVREKARRKLAKGDGNAVLSSDELDQARRSGLVKDRAV